MRGKSVLQEVSIDEMMELRNEGYSNNEIAELLDCSYQTVKRYIGIQGFRMQNNGAKIIPAPPQNAIHSNAHLIRIV